MIVAEVQPNNADCVDPQFLNADRELIGDDVVNGSSP
jgi:hypothetical protein